jgi:hypothetical protein
MNELLVPVDFLQDSRLFMKNKIIYAENYLQSRYICLIVGNQRTKLTSVNASVSDLHSLYADPDPASSKSADPDLITEPNPGTK